MKANPLRLCRKTRKNALLELLEAALDERKHCVIYEHTIVTAKFWADELKDRARVKPLVRTGNKKTLSVT